MSGGLGRAAFVGREKEYDRWFSRNRAAYLSELDLVRRHLPQEGRGVEIGAGTGRFGTPLGLRLGVEPVLGMARLATRRGMRMVGGLAEALPFRTGSFDYLLMVNVICFLDEPLAALAEANRVLKTHGRLILAFLDRGSRLGREYERRKVASPFYGAARFYSAREVKSLLDVARFQLRSRSQTILSMPEALAEPESGRPEIGRGLFAVCHAQKA